MSFRSPFPFSSPTLRQVRGVVVRVFEFLTCELLKSYM